MCSDNGTQISQLVVWFICIKGFQDLASCDEKKHSALFCGPIGFLNCFLRTFVLRFRGQSGE